MPTQLTPDDHDALFADIDRRLKLLEVSQRVGLNGVRAAWMTGTAVTTVYDVWDPGPAGATWADDQGATGTGYPIVTITNMPARAIVVWEARPANVGDTPAATYKTSSCQLAIAINGLTDYTALPGGYYPKSNRQFVNVGGNGAARIPFLSTAMRQFNAGETYTFQMTANFNNAAPGNPTGPTLTDCQIFVLPLAAS